MIRFALDSPDEGPGYVLVATVELPDRTMPALFSGVLKDERAIALQARELADAAAALIESFVETPQIEQAFERLHDALDLLPTEST